MSVNRNKLYSLFGLLSLAGYFWLFINEAGYIHSKVSVCPMKLITKIPCPSCGSTRSAELILQGKLKEALLINPFGYLDIIVLAIIPIWLITDLLTKNDSLYRFYLYLEKNIRCLTVATPLILLILLNWLWNIFKNL